VSIAYAEQRRTAYRREVMGQTPFEFKPEWVVPLGITAALIAGVVIAKRKRRKR